MTDTERVLQLFRQSNGRLISNSSIIDGSFFGTKPVLNWSARITDARHKINCNCGQDEKTCTATEHIRNVKKNWYQYVNDKKPVFQEPPKHTWVNTKQLENQINELKKEYVATEGWRKDIIRIQGQALRRSLDIQKGLSSEVQNTMEALI